MAKVAILGGGVAGLSAAHELIDRGFEVEVYERNDVFGGKARSIPVEGSATGKRKPLPAEHGFRFFPGFYRHLTNTMGRIPYGQDWVVNNLVPAKKILMAQAGRRNELIAPAELPATIEDFTVLAQFMLDFAVQLRIAPWDLAFFMRRLFTLLISCDERRYEQWEHLSWWEFTGAEKRSEKYRKFLADGMTRTLVAAQAKQMSARTGGLILWQIVFDMIDSTRPVDSVLNGPTSEVWIDPWVDYLKGKGVELVTGREVTEIRCENGTITKVVMTGTDGAKYDVGDSDYYYVAAMPVERLDVLVSPALKAAEPRLSGLKRLVTRWMNGVIFYLDRDVPMERGHTLFVDSEWALTAISQPQFWKGIDLTKRGNGKVKGILSVDVSDWYTPGKRTGKPAIECSDREIRTEVWGQILDHIDDGTLDEANIIDWFLDPAIKFPNPAVVTNEEPLLVNTAGSWHDRPEADTAIPNFFLAADFVRTHTDLATMEAANEAARRAVNGILTRSGSTEKPCDVIPLPEPVMFAGLRELDRLRWRVEKSFGSLLRDTQATALDATNLVAQSVLTGIRRLR